MPDPIPSKVSQQIAWRRASDDYTDPEYATYRLGVDRRPCIFDCNGTTTRPDGICELHDFLPCCSGVLVPNDSHGHASWCPTPERLPYHMERQS